jgi:hypothetical protein
MTYKIPSFDIGPMARHSNLDHAFLAKAGFLLGLAMFTIGGGGELLGHAIYGSLPAWETTLFFDLEVLGLLIGFVSPLVFAILLPLVE